MLLIEDKGEDEVTIINKLTEYHTDPNKIPKMKVKYAAQVFSERVSAVMKFLASKFSYLLLTRIIKLASLCDCIAIASVTDQIVIIMIIFVILYYDYKYIPMYSCLSSEYDDVI